MAIHVGEKMTRNLITAHWTETLASAFAKMKRSQIRHLPVLNDSGELVGIISERDLERAMYTQSNFISAKVQPAEFDSDALVRDYMSWPVRTVTATTELRTVAELMIDQKISAAVVVDPNKVVGIITHEDLLKLLVQILSDTPPNLRKLVDDLTYNTPIGRIVDTLNQAGI